MTNNNFEFHLLPELDLMGNQIKKENFFIPFPDGMGELKAAYTNFNVEKNIFQLLSPTEIICIYIGELVTVVYWINKDSTINKTKRLSHATLRTIRTIDKIEYLWYDNKGDKIPFEILFKNKKLTNSTLLK